MRIDQDPRLPTEFNRSMLARLYDLFRQVAQQVNALAEGQIVAAHNAASGPPTTGTHYQGDVVRNREPAELGAAGSKYVLTGWVCVASGTPGTWREMRAATGG